MVERLWTSCETQYNLDWYIVKEWDTSLNVLSEIFENKWINDKFKDKIKDLLNKYNELFDIHEWDKLSIIEQDENQIQIIFDTKKWEQYVYKINLLDNTILSLEDKQNEVIHDSRWWLYLLKQWILKELSENLNPELETIRTDIIKFLSFDKFILEDNKKFFDYQNILYSSKYENNKIAIEYRKVIDILTLPWDISVDDAIDTISKVFEDKNITKSTKIRLAKWLRETFFWYLTEKVNGGYVLDPWKWIDITNELKEKFPQYNFDDYVMVPDPEWWEPIYTNIK